MNIPILSSLFGSKPAQQSAPGKAGFRSYVSPSDGDAAYDTAAEILALVGAAGAGYRTIWKKTIPAQTMYSWGFGSPALPDNQGYAWFAMIDAGTNFHIGFLRLCQTNARETRTQIVAEIPDSQLHGATNTSIATAQLIDRQQMIAIPEKTEYELVGEDSMLTLQYALVTTATTADVADFRIPVTIYQ